MRTTYRAAVAEVLQAHQGEWVHWSRLAQVGGALAWRTRVSDCRRELGMAIDNKVVPRSDGVRESFYRYCPERLF
jgi:hypothetical protein